MEPRAFFRKRYRVKLAKESDADHWSGGSPYHRGALCPTCKIPLLLLWDINCKDPRFPSGKFGPLDRLPLYYCWGCVNDIYYQVIDRHKIRIHSSERWAGGSIPYDPYPEHFERRGLLLFEGVPDEIRRIYKTVVNRWETGAGRGKVPEPTPREQKTLTEFFGHSVLMPRCFFHHQLGGKPLVDDWANQVFECPNPACEGSIKDRERGRKRAMKFLAGVLNDPWAGLPMAESKNAKTKKYWDYSISVQFHICDCCWTVLGCNRCD